MKFRGPPPPQVVAAFGVSDARPRALAGGEARAWAAGDLILKPIHDHVEATWVAEVLADLVEDGFRINRPVKSRTDAWVVDGWSAWTTLLGEHDTSGRWVDVLRVGERLSAALRGVARPAFLDSRSHPWAVGDRAAWGEEPPVVVHDVLEPLADRLSALIQPDESPSQVIHGDLTGNILFAPRLAPGVIDFTPYWRPARFCQAIVIVDALLWHAAPAGLSDALPGADDRVSLLARAALYRLITSDRLAADQEPAARGEYLRSTVMEHGYVLDLLSRDLT